MAKTKHILLLIANITGVIVSLYSLVFTERLNNYISNTQLICDINKTFSCSTTYISKYAHVFDIPVSLFTLLFFWYVVFFLLLNTKKETNPLPLQMLSLLNFVALLICLYFLYILIFILRSICLSCLFIDIIVVVNFILLFTYFRKSLNFTKVFIVEILAKNRLTILSFLLLITCGIVFYSVYRGTLKTKDRLLLNEFYKQKPIEELACGNSIIWGDKKGEIHIRIFNDFFCGYCKIASLKYRELFKNFHTVKIEFICFPLNYSSNNASRQKNIDIYLTKVMLAAGQYDDFWNFYDLTINQMGRLDSAKIFEIASKNISDYENFRYNFSSTNYDSIIQKNIRIAQEYKVSGTPSIFINGREFQQWNNINLLKMIICEETRLHP